MYLQEQAPQSIYDLAVAVNYVEEGYGNYYYYRSPSTHAQVLAYYDDKTSITRLAFAGTNHILDWIYNLAIVPIHVPAYETYLHYGFNAHATSLLHKMYEWTFVRKSSRIELIGFSLGGATAAIMALYISGFRKPMSVITMGSPKYTMAQYKLDIPIVNYYYTNDIIARIPCQYEFSGVNRNLGWKAVLNPHNVHQYVRDIIHYESTLPKI